MAQEPKPTAPAAEEAARPKNFHYTIHVADKKQLHALYMPFIKNGGIFIATPANHQLNNEIDVKLKLLDEPQEHWVHGKVVWINPFAAQGGLPQGIGIQFGNKEARLLRDKIENLLAGFSGANSRTQTM